MEYYMDNDDFMESIVKGDNYVDVTDTVKCYKNGKTLECPCGHGIGVVHDVMSVACYGCKSAVLVDRRYNTREPPEIENEQTTLSEW